MRKLQPERHGQGRGELGVGQWLGAWSRAVPNELSLFQSKRREEEWKRRVVHSRRWVRGSMGPPGRVGWACRSRRNLKGQRVPSEGPAGRIRCASCRKELLHC